MRRESAIINRDRDPALSAIWGLVRLCNDRACPWLPHRRFLNEGAAKRLAQPTDDEDCSLARLVDDPS